MAEENIQIILKRYNSNFITYEISPGIYPIENFSEFVYTMEDHEGTLQIDFDDKSMKSKFFLDVLVVPLGC